ncbi:ABC-type multidrug transport system permease component [Paramagnetospirillum magnetotacticum MS-1]|uniref:Transport permease protein n=1 Tax=Paramagnetospirillum magnetotacticum MS-1 TaxID=272627 RepID=A0A0C2UZG5_PARME|nr:ABC transporter permease [Paramagnetospirillum magnetotacticum]KIL98211.1 ABC-type multidrug transport system permease component [Paramagnetospirillum magnetotacticum MS-1]
MRDDQSILPPVPRSYGRVNWLGAWTLLMKEVRRFLKVYFQTIIAPVVTTLLFLSVFALALGPVAAQVKGVPFVQFLAPGLIMMAIVQNAFANTSSSIIIAKVQGNIVDMLMPPLTGAEQTAAVALGGVARGLAVGIAVGLAMALFVPMPVHNPALIVYHAVMGSLMLSLLGMMGGIWADKFDHMAAVTNFIVTPLSFLSGTFYSIDRLPPAFHTVALANPFFYMIDGFRAGFIGVSDGSVALGVMAMAMADLVLLLITWRMLDSGYKLRS